MKINQEKKGLRKNHSRHSEFFCNQACMTRHLLDDIHSRDVLIRLTLHEIGVVTIVFVNISVRF